MTQPEDFSPYAELADALMSEASKEQLAEVARLLALNIGWYHRRYSDVPQEALLALLRADDLTDEGRALLLHGMQSLVSALAEVMEIGEDGAAEARH